MPQLIGILIIIGLYLLYIALLIYVSIYLFPIGCVVFTGAVLFNYVRTMYEELVVGKGWIDSPTGSEPAYKQYYFRKAFHDYRRVVEKSFEKNRTAFLWVIGFGTKIIGHELWFLTFPLGITVYLIAAAGAAVGFVTYVIFGLLHLAIVATCVALGIATAYSLWFFEYLQMLWRQINIRCPHKNCHKPIKLPLYNCSECSKKHEKLVPGSYGVFRRQCSCGAWLPTLFLFGRNQLPSYCPHLECGQSLDSGTQITRNLLIPIVGGVSAGKTNYLIASLLEIHRRADAGGASVAFSQEKYKKIYEISKRNFQSGNVAGKTVEESPDAFLINVNTGGEDRMLYIYDAAGELFQRTDNLRLQEYYRDFNGIVFLIDPFSLTQIQDTLENELAAAESQIKPSAERPQDIYDKLLQTIQQETGAGKGAMAKPLAVVVTKDDAFGVAEQIRDIASMQPPLEKNAKHTRESLAVRTWLDKNGAGNLIRGMEKDFREVAYFHCSPLGRMPDAGTTPFTPKRVLEPLGWLLKNYGLDFVNGTASRAIAEVKTVAATRYKATVTPCGETMNGKLIAALWAASIVVLFFGSFLSLTSNGPGTRNYAMASTTNSNTSYPMNSNTRISTNANVRTPSNSSKSSPNSFLGNTSVREYGGYLRSEPSDSGYINQNLSTNTPLKVIERKSATSKWYRVQTKDGTIGWIDGNEIYPIR